MAVAALSWPGEVFRYPAPGTVLPLWDVPDEALSAGMNAALSGGGLPSDTTMNLFTGAVAGPLGTGAILVILACALFLLVRGHLQLSTLLPYLIVCIAVPWLLPQLTTCLRSASRGSMCASASIWKNISSWAAACCSAVFSWRASPSPSPRGCPAASSTGCCSGGAATVFRYNTVYETGICFALLIVGAFPEWLDRVARRAERMRFRKKEEKRRANRAKPEAI